MSGIDGSTSTAAGAACVGEGMTVLITGDMSFSYDVNGLSSTYLSPRFKIIVMCNGGGGIFRFIKPTSDLPELETCFEIHRDISVEKYADLFGLRYFELNDEKSAAEVLSLFFAEEDRRLYWRSTPRMFIMPRFCGDTSAGRGNDDNDSI